ncbi:MAG TPA: glycosyltransferase [Bacillota bacterium]
MNASVVVPAHNEAGRVGAVVAALAGLPRVSQVLVVDDGSTDATADEARRAGAEVIRLPRRRGKASALAAGVARAAGEVVLLADADLGATAVAVAPLIDAVGDGFCDLAVGRLPPQERGGGWGLAVRLARRAMVASGGPRLESPLSGQRACRRELLRTLPTWGVGYGVEVAINLHALRCGARIHEIDIDARHRVTGRDLPGILHRARQFRDIAATLVMWGWKR